ncbi:MAG: HEAT repeat domain-containing protein [Myxococcota bacterium]|nr:HEAT repeat domain-containing protein [Myxococcota bacterium]
MVTIDDGANTAVRDVLKKMRDVAGLYETEREQFQAALPKISEALRRILGEFGEFELNVSTNRIMLNEDEVYKSEARSNNLAFDLFRQGLRRIGFRPGLSDEEVASFMTRFADCRTADQIDEDFVTLMWQDSTANITVLAIDNYTEKIFMSETEFVASFRSVLDDVAPGLTTMDDEDVPDVEPRNRVELDASIATDKADLEQRKARKFFEQAQEEGTRAQLRTPTDLRGATDHLTYLLVCQILERHGALSTAELQGIIVRILTGYLEAANWQGFADALRSLHLVFEALESLGPILAERVSRVRRVVSGRDMAEQIAEHLDPEQTNFTAWTRWFYTTEEQLTAPAILELINTCANSAGVDWLKDLLRRQSTESLDPWVERLRDPNPRIVIEVIEVITSSELGPQAKPLLVEALRHDESEVRACALNALKGTYDQAVRQEMLPLLKDPDSTVRRLVIERFIDAKDRSVSPYLANMIKSGEVDAFEEDEQRKLFVGLARLGGEAFFSLFKDQLQLDERRIGRFLKRKEAALSDSTIRRAAISALGTIGSSQSSALIQDVKRRADLALAAHCDVVIRLANRKTTDDVEHTETDMGQRDRIEDVNVGRHRMGDAVLFTLEELGFERLVDTETAPPDILAPISPTHPPQAPAVSEVRAIEDGPPRIQPTPRVGVVGANALLTEEDVLSPWDRIKLGASPSTLRSERFELQDIDLVMTGVQPGPSPRRQVDPSLPPMRIIERSKAPKDERAGRAMMNAKPAMSPDVPDLSGSMDDILKNYVGDEAPGPADSAVAGDNVEDILSQYLADGDSQDTDRRASPNDESKEPDISKSLDSVLQEFLDSDLEK